VTTPANNTPFYIICDAYSDAGMTKRGQTPGGDQLAEGLRRLNDIVAFMRTGGIKLFLWEDVTVPLVAGQNEYSFSPTGDVVMSKPLRVDMGYYVDSADNRRPLSPLSWDEWIQLSQTTAVQGAINSYFQDKQATEILVSFWNTPDTQAATGEVHLIMRTQPAAYTTLTEATIFPDEWRIALHWALAEQICTGQPEAIVQRCTANAEKFRLALEGWDVEDADVRFTPSQQFRSGGRFQ